MKSFLRLFVVGLLAALAHSLPVFAQLKTDSPLPTHQELNRLGLERGWWGHAVLNPSRDKIKHMSIDEDTIYMQANSGVTTAFDAESGQQLWAVHLGRFDEPSFPAVSNENQALIVVGSTMYALEKRTGKTVWTLILTGQPSTGPSLDDKHVYFGTLDGSVYAYSLRKIRQLYEERRLPQWSMEAQVWKYKAGKEITSPPISTGRVVNFGSSDGILYSVNAVDRKTIFQLETDKPIIAPLTRLDNTMFMASEDYTFYALNLFSGRVKWEFTSGLPIRKTPWALDNTLFLLPDRGGMYCLDPETGVRRWWKPDLTNFIAILGNTVAASDGNGNLVMVSRDKGETIGSLPLRRYTVRTGNDRTDRIYMATESGIVICLRQSGHTYPVFHRFPDRLPLLPEITPDDDESSMPETEANSAE